MCVCVCVKNHIHMLKKKTVRPTTSSSDDDSESDIVLRPMTQYQEPRTSQQNLTILHNFVSFHHLVGILNQNAASLHKFFVVFTTFQRRTVNLLIFDQIYTHCYIYIYIYMYIYILLKLATFVKDDPKAPFSIANKPRCREERYYIPLIAPLYPWSVPYKAEC